MHMREGNRGLPHDSCPHSVDWSEMWLVSLRAEGSDQVLCLRESGKMILDFRPKRKAWKIRSLPRGWEVTTLVQLPTSVLPFLYNFTARPPISHILGHCSCRSFLQLRMTHSQGSPITEMFP